MKDTVVNTRFPSAPTLGVHPSCGKANGLLRHPSRWWLHSPRPRPPQPPRLHLHLHPKWDAVIRRGV